MVEEKLYSVREVAEFLGVKPAAVWRYINNGDLKARKFGKQSKNCHWRIKQSDLEKFAHLNNGEGE